MRITRRHLQLSLAGLWLFDAVLQCQPRLFTNEFTRSVLVPARQGQLSVLAGPLHQIATLVSAHPALANASFALIQIALGLGLLTRRLARPALAGSILWALMVWVVGEGMGGISTGATLLSGAPGAALLYAVIALIAWPTGDRIRDERPSSWAIPAWSALWLSGAVLQLVNGNNSATAFKTTLRGAQSGSPGWIAALDHHLSQLPAPSWTPAFLCALYVLVAMWVWLPGWTRQLSLGIGTFVALTGWLLFQGLGDLSSGHATDPNAGPLVVLLAVAVLGALQPVERRAPKAQLVLVSEPLLSRQLVGSASLW